MKPSDFELRLVEVLPEALIPVERPAVGRQLGLVRLLPRRLVVAAEEQEERAEPVPLALEDLLRGRVLGVAAEAPDVVLVLGQDVLDVVPVLRARVG